MFDTIYKALLVEIFIPKLFTCLNQTTSYKIQTCFKILRFLINFFYQYHPYSLRGSSLRPLLPTFRSGAGISPGCIHFFPALLCPVSPNTTSSFDVTTSAAGSGRGVPSARTPYQQISNMLAVRVLGLANVGAQVP